MFPFPDDAVAYGKCTRYSLGNRKFFFAYPNESAYTLRLGFSFEIYDINTKPIGLIFSDLEVVWTYTAPHFPANAHRYGKCGGGGGGSDSTSSNLAVPYCEA